MQITACATAQVAIAATIVLCGDDDNVYRVNMQSLSGAAINMKLP